MITLAHPLPGGTLTAHYGPRPAFTQNGVFIPAMLHNGTDFAAPAGTPILAAHDGQVTFNGWDSAGGGWTVQVTGSFGRTMYCHMNQRSTVVRSGDHVAAGQVIGHVGSSGTATGPHLHFMLNFGHGWVNPHPYIGVAPPTQKPASIPTTPNTKPVTPPATAGDLGDIIMQLWIAIADNKWYWIVPTGASKPNAALMPANSGMDYAGAAKAGIPVVNLGTVARLKKVANV